MLERRLSGRMRGKMEAKSEIRRRILKVRGSLTEEQKVRAAFLLTERILGHQWYYLSDVILCYANYASEISTEEIIREALSAGKKVYLPRVEGNDMKFYRILDMAELVNGYRGIPEPQPNNDCYQYSEKTAENTLLLMPGVAFDRYRNRIGYGKGYYDRFLTDKPGLQFRSIAVGFECQMVEELPAEETDIRPYQVILV